MDYLGKFRTEIGWKFEKLLNSAGNWTLSKIDDAAGQLEVKLFIDSLLGLMAPAHCSSSPS